MKAGGLFTASVPLVCGWIVQGAYDSTTPHACSRGSEVHQILFVVSRLIPRSSLACLRRRSELFCAFRQSFLIPRPWVSLVHVLVDCSNGYVD